jgi:DNA polymerase III sliding clamp (beta) subunit (PCNA family)
MLKELKFVMGALSKKDLVPSMKHFVIENGKARAFNGMVALCSPIPFDINCKPHGETLYRALENCDEAITLYMTPAGKLGVKSGSFRCLVPCIEETAVHPEPEGVDVPIDGALLLKAFKVLEPIIGDDASRPWQAGILLKGDSAYATCNPVLAQYWMGGHFPHVVNIPGNAVREVIRIGEPPIRAQCTENSFTFHFEDGRWIRTNLLPTTWPDVSRILDQTGAEPKPVDTNIFLALDKLKKFIDKAGRVYFREGLAHTHVDPDEGTTFEMPGSTMAGIYNWEMLKLLDGLAEQADFSRPGKASLFYGGGGYVRGAIIGMSM